MNDVAERLLGVRAEIDAAARAAGRDPAAVSLVAVSKKVPPERILLAYEAGQRDFGENYAQELRDKRQVLPSDIRWHFIGRLQANKAKYLDGCFRVHAVDALSQAEALASRASSPIALLIAVNAAGEASKGGVSPEEALPLARAVAALPGAALRGLMTMPPPDADPAPFFARVAALAEEGRREGLALQELSMGMSGDFPAAIAHGATWVRVGTAIFGARQA